jgi:hypothetical protein
MRSMAPSPDTACATSTGQGAQTPRPPRGLHPTSIVQPPAAPPEGPSSACGQLPPGSTATGQQGHLDRPPPIDKPHPIGRVTRRWTPHRPQTRPARSAEPCARVFTPPVDAPRPRPAESRTRSPPRRPRTLCSQDRPPHLRARSHHPLETPARKTDRATRALDRTRSTDVPRPIDRVTDAGPHGVRSAHLLAASREPTAGPGPGRRGLETTLTVEKMVDGSRRSASWPEESRAGPRAGDERASAASRARQARRRPGRPGVGWGLVRRRAALGEACRATDPS